MQGKFYNDDPLASSSYTDKLGHVWTVANDGLESWWAEPAAESSKFYGIPVGTDRHRIIGTTRSVVAEAIDDAVYRWQVTTKAAARQTGGIWVLVVLGVLYYADKRKHRGRR